MSKLYQEICWDATDICKVRGKNDAWLWEQDYARLIAEETLKWVNDNVGMITTEATEDLLVHLGINAEL